MAERKIKKPYNQEIKRAMHDLLTMTEDEVKEVLKSDCPLAYKMAGAHILKDCEMPTPQEGTYISKTTGDMVEQTETKVTSFTDIIKNLASDSEY